MNDRKPRAGHANYPGAAEHMVGRVYGPNALGEWLTAVTTTYNPATNKSRVGFDFANPAEVDLVRRALGGAA